MQKTALIKHLRAIARDLEPLTQAAAPGDMAWDGKEYRQVTSEAHPDPYALAWWSKLNTLADMIDYQDTELSAKQLSYLQRALFGGMGSLNDLWFDERRYGQTAKEINNKLGYSREELFSAFKELGGI
jgi:hypothetical protein